MLITILGLFSCSSTRNTWICKKYENIKEKEEDKKETKVIAPSQSVQGPIIALRRFVVLLFVALFLCPCQPVELLCAHFSLLCRRTADYIEHESVTKMSGRLTGICHLTFKLIFPHLYFICLPHWCLCLSLFRIYLLNQ